jgi:lysyl-tRNA synthetase, class II
MMVMWKPLASHENGAQLAGYARVLQKRNMGALSFWRARFNDETIQLVLSRDQLKDYAQVRKIPPGSIIYITGEKCVTRTGEHSLMVLAIEERILCTWSMPDKYHGISQEQRYRLRVMDLICNAESFDFLRFVSQAVCEVRRLLWESGFREFNTGILQEYFEGGQAEPFRTHCQATGKELFLSLTSELKLKRLIIAGFERVFEVTQSFRNEGMDPFHSPEFSMLEVYAQEHTCEDMMRTAETMVQQVAKSYAPSLQCLGADQVPILFKGPYQRIPFAEAYKRHVGPIEECTLPSLAVKHPQMFHLGMTKFTWMMKVIERMIVPKIWQPTFLTELPSGLSPLVKVCVDDPSVTERAFFIANGMFFADIYTDENDLAKVRAGLEAQSRETGRPANEDYLSLLAYGLPPTAGIGLSLNRLFMAFLETLPRNIKETFCYSLL